MRFYRILLFALLLVAAVTSTNIDEYNASEDQESEPPTTAEAEENNQQYVTGDRRTEYAYSSPVLLGNRRCKMMTIPSVIQRRSTVDRPITVSKQLTGKNKNSASISGETSPLLAENCKTTDSKDRFTNTWLMVHFNTKVFVPVLSTETSKVLSPGTSSRPKKSKLVWERYLAKFPWTWTHRFLITACREVAWLGAVGRTVSAKMQWLDTGTKMETVDQKSTSIEKVSRSAEMHTSVEQRSSCRDEIYLFSQTRIINIFSSMLH